MVKIKQDKSTNNDLQNVTQITKDLQKYQMSDNLGNFHIFREIVEGMIQQV